MRRDEHWLSSPGATSSVAGRHSERLRGMVQPHRSRGRIGLEMVQSRLEHKVVGPDVLVCSSPAAP